MSGVGEYKTRKGNMSGPSLVGFLAPDTHTNALRKQPEVKEMPDIPTFTMKVTRHTQKSNHALPPSEARHA